MEKGCSHSSPGWKTFEPLWDLVIKARRLAAMTPLLEGVLSKVSGAGGGPPTLAKLREKPSR